MQETEAYAELDRRWTALLAWRDAYVRLHGGDPLYNDRRQIEEWQNFTAAYHGGWLNWCWLAGPAGVGACDVLVSQKEKFEALDADLRVTESDAKVYGYVVTAKGIPGMAELSPVFGTAEKIDEMAKGIEDKLGKGADVLPWALLAGLAALLLLRR